MRNCHLCRSAKIVKDSNKGGYDGLGMNITGRFFNACCKLFCHSSRRKTSSVHQLFLCVFGPTVQLPSP
jgi:hypothetical protein